ncbi:dynein heavy chain 2 axonemal [Crotalus adamanteus]|uniref:Dynein heavy chain 2 axonemal n=1 Tax=Crotalus adamanteus TaxID=8729 RepID=A0AAW1B9U3_CROAD
MGPAGGGRTVISSRLQSRFNLINMTFPTDSQIRRIFGTMINQKLQNFEEAVKPIGNVITEATVELYNSVVQRFLPTPAKIHYLFNLRDISKVFQGMLRAHKDFHDTKASLTRLWIHECFRVFSDRLVDSPDMETFVALLSEKLGTFFDLTFHHICPNKRSPIFGDFMRNVYEDMVDMGVLKAEMERALGEYNRTPGLVPMRLVLFRDAIEHITRIVRVISQPRGNMLLVGIGGSGRQSLARLASSICEYYTFQIEVSRQYRKQEFREDIKKLYRQTGVDLKPTTFLFVDTQIADECFLEDINNVLSSGEVPNLYKSDEFEEIQTHIIEAARAEGIQESQDSLFAYLIERVRNNLHVVLCLSPVGDPFRNRIRQYPALVNCTTIDWFSEWPKEALLEVAEKYLEGVDLGLVERGSLDTMQKRVAKIFVTMHWSVARYSHKMLLELRRHNYVTPTNYLELVSGYKKLLAEKRKELSDQANKLRNGLFKIDETREKVEVMTLELEEARRKVAEFQKQCEEYLVIIVQQKREADEQQKTVTANSEKIAAEEIKCKALADNAQKDLEEALPALEEAMKALESLNKKDLTEIKSYGRPPTLVETVMQAVMILRGNEPTWTEAKKQLGEPNFIKQLVHFDKDNISDKVLKKISAYCSQPDFQPDIIGRVSVAAKSLCMWVRAMEMYGRIYRVVEPKRARMNAALAQLAEKQAAQAEAQERLREVAEKLEMLKKEYEEKLAQKEELRKKSEEMEVKLDRADKLVSGLAGEKIRWEETVKGLEEDLGYLVGDCLLASAFVSYMGPFLSNYRDEMVSHIWMKQIRQLHVPCSPSFTCDSFLSNPTLVRTWNIQGLPSDDFSTENGIIVTRGNRWPLMIDPQCQATKWIKNMEANKGLKIIDLQMPDYLRVLEAAIQLGSPVLLQNVQEELDPTLAPILNKSVTKVGGRLLIRLGDKEVEYHPEFRFYLTTKLSNPHYTPETSSQTTIVNFAVKEQGLEAQLLGIVVRKEQPELEEQKGSLVLNIAAGKRKLKELEDEILRLLNEATGSLLDDVQLVNTLQTSKVTATEVTEQLETSEMTEIKIDTAREAYRPCAQRASILFFVLNDMGRIDPMYQFSLDAYIDLFNLSINKSHRSHKLDERIRHLNEYHTYAVYRYTCRGLFERHKLLFSFQMCAKILETSGSLKMDEYNFFLRGGVVLDREGQMDNPCTSWLSDIYWDNITELDKLTNFHGIMNSFEQYPRDWNLWYTSSKPEKALLPGEWENSCNQMQRMLVVRSLRPDRVAFCVTAFIVSNLGSQFIEPPVLNMKSVVDDSTTKTPLIFVLSPGVDPTSSLLQLAENSGMAQRFHALSLGQGQAPIATRMIKDGVHQGNWVFLANCHLSLSWMPQLDKLVEQLQVEEPHPSFRLWLSSSPHPEFPISILQAGIKMTTEPPTGLKANMKRLYQLITDPQFNRCTKPSRYKKLLFALCFFHSVLLERKKFLQLGWNIVYGFNDSDFEVSENLLSLYLDEYEDTPWDALKYLIAGVNYGGHVTDDWDRRLLTTYINDYFCDQTVAAPFYKLTALDTYYIPKDGNLSSYKEYISLLPGMDPPEAFGQHPNADVASQITEARTLFETLLSLQPQTTPTGAAGQSREDKVLELSSDVRSKIPEEIDYEGTCKVLSTDPSPLNVVLLQEIQRYNSLLQIISSSLVELEKGIQGLVVMSTDLEEIFNCIFDARVPPMWERAYSSQKPLAAWTRDLGLRVEQFARWAKTAHPPVLFWLSGFTFPTGFLTAVLQAAARQNNISVDTLSWEFIVSTVDDNNLVYPPKEGVWIRGLFLEGAGWDKKNSCLVEAEPMQLVCPIPTIHFKPVENKKKSSKGIYSCPCYYYPNRAGSSGRPSFVIGVDLRSGAMPPDHWIKRGTALLMSLDAQGGLRASGCPFPWAGTEQEAGRREGGASPAQGTRVTPAAAGGGGGEERRAGQPRSGNATAQPAVLFQAPPRGGESHPPPPPSPLPAGEDAGAAQRRGPGRTWAGQGASADPRCQVSSGRRKCATRPDFAPGTAVSPPPQLPEGGLQVGRAGVGAFTPKGGGGSQFVWEEEGGFASPPSLLREFAKVPGGGRGGKHGAGVLPDPSSSFWPPASIPKGPGGGRGGKHGAGVLPDPSSSFWPPASIPKGPGGGRGGKHGAGVLPDPSSSFWPPASIPKGGGGSQFVWEEEGGFASPPSLLREFAKVPGGRERREAWGGGLAGPLLLLLAPGFHSQRWGGSQSVWEEEGGFASPPSLLREFAKVPGGGEEGSMGRGSCRTPPPPFGPRLPFPKVGGVSICLGGGGGASPLLPRYSVNLQRSRGGGRGGKHGAGVLPDPSSSFWPPASIPKGRRGLALGHSCLLEGCCMGVKRGDWRLEIGQDLASNDSLGATGSLGTVIQIGWDDGTRSLAWLEGTLLGKDRPCVRSHPASLAHGPFVRLCTEHTQTHTQPRRNQACLEVAGGLRLCGGFCSFWSPSHPSATEGGRQPQRPTQTCSLTHALHAPGNPRPWRRFANPSRANEFGQLLPVAGEGRKACQAGSEPAATCISSSWVLHQVEGSSAGELACQPQPTLGCGVGRQVQPLKGETFAGRTDRRKAGGSFQVADPLRLPLQSEQLSSALEMDEDDVTRPAANGLAATALLLERWGKEGGAWQQLLRPARPPHLSPPDQELTPRPSSHGECSVAPFPILRPSSFPESPSLS